jgi:nucleoside-diphosphate-sugar epimerase
VKRLAITGATGFVGGALLRALDTRAAAGEEFSVRALERRPGSVPRADRPWLEVVPGDVRDSVPPALLAGAEVLFHLATLGIDQGEGFQATNVAGTRRLIESADDALRVTLYTSSISVYGQGPQRGEGEDVLSVAPETPLAKSRAEAERILSEAMASRGGSLVCTRPRYILGQGDRHTLPGLTKLARAGWILGEGSQRFSVIDVDDYAQVLLRAAERELASEEPFRGGLHVGYRQGLSLRDLLGPLAEAAERPPPSRRLRVPGFVVSGLAAFPNRKARRGATIYQLFGQDHLVGVDRLADWLGEEFVSRDPREVLRQAIAWQGAQPPQS